MTTIHVAPNDEYNQELVQQAHPPDWKNPEGGHYNLVAIGGGTAGIISALFAAGIGGRSALIERHLLGGDCLNYGCVPSKALIRAARAAYEVSHADRFGVQAGADGRVAFAEVMRRMRRLRAQICHHDSAERFTKLGADVYLGEARFTGKQSLEVNGRELTFARCVIATGGRAARPPIPGLEEVGYLTNESIFSLTELPRRLLVLGGGPIGAEMAQAFRRFGSEVTLVNRPPRLLNKEDPAASEIVRRQFEREGIALHLGATAIRAEKSNGSKRLVIEAAGKQLNLDADEILVAIGRTPNVEGLNLEAAGVEYDGRGVKVDDRLRTTNGRIYAAGDIVGGPLFTHAADAMARMCVQNAFFFGRKKLSKLVVPRTTYTDPEVAHVGLTPAEAEEKGIDIDTYREELKNVDRAILDSEDEGFAAVHCRKGTGKIVGATIVGTHAGEMIGEMSLMMTKRINLGTLGGTIHCYPTQVEVLKRIGDQYNKTKLTPFVAKLLRWIMSWRS